MNRLVSTCVSIVVLAGGSSVTMAQPQILQRLHARTPVQRPLIGGHKTVVYVPMTVVSQSVAVAPKQTILVRESVAPSTSTVQVAQAATSSQNVVPVATTAQAAYTPSPSDIVFGSATVVERPQPEPVTLTSHVSPTAVAATGHYYANIAASPSPIVTSAIVPVPVVVTNRLLPIFPRRPVYSAIAPVTVVLVP